MSDDRSIRVSCFRMVSLVAALVLSVCSNYSTAAERERVSINDDWRFMKYAADAQPDGLAYDKRPQVSETRDDRSADAEPTAPAEFESSLQALKPWVLPTGNDLIRDEAMRHQRPAGDPGGDFPFVQFDFDDRGWDKVTLPHDWAIAGPFMQGPQAPVGGGMGRLPSPGVAWYRRKLDVPASDAGRRIFLDVDGAMSYAIVWINGHLAGGWPYGYTSWRVDLTPYLNPGGSNQLAIRLDNPPHSSRWYPGGGIYRNVWLTKTAPVHVAHWGTFITTPKVMQASAEVHLAVKVDNHSHNDVDVEVNTTLFELDSAGKPTGEPVARFDALTTTIAAGGQAELSGDATLPRPRLWGPPPTQTPNRYLAVTTVSHDRQVVDRFETTFGVRELRFDPASGVYVNGEKIRIQGANMHHDLGALGAAFNVRAAQRQLELLREMGCNAIRMAHNPPAPELLDLTDRMGLLVIDETFDVWERKKTPLDSHLVFPDWHEQDTRALVRRDRNHPSVIAWSIGNEVGEQYTGDEGAAVARRLGEIVHQEDSTRPTTTAMNFAKPPMPLPGCRRRHQSELPGRGHPRRAGLRRP